MRHFRMFLKLLTQTKAEISIHLNCVKRYAAQVDDYFVSFSLKASDKLTLDERLLIVFCRLFGNECNVQRFGSAI